MAMTLTDWCRETRRPVRKDTRRFLDQLPRLIDDYAVHMPAWQRSNPDALAHLLHLADAPPAQLAQVHDILLTTFAQIGDRHSRVILPPPWNDSYAFLPFVLGPPLASDTGGLPVLGSALDGVAPGDHLMLWNDENPIDVLNRHAALQLGANAHARRAKALQTLAVRPLALMPAPQNTPVTLEFRTTSGRRLRHVLEWQVAPAVELARTMAACQPQDPQVVQGACGTSCRAIHVQDRRYLWLRLPSLRVQPMALFDAVNALVMAEASESVLLIDLRGCEEGYVQTGLALVQGLTHRTVTPLCFDMRVTPAMQQLTANSAALARWHSALKDAPLAGHCQPLPLVDVPPVAAGAFARDLVVLVDANTYSTAEMVARIVQAMGLGRVLGTAPCTGGGGGSPWSQKTIARFANDPDLEPEPGVASLQLAVLRCNDAAGPIEGRGIVPDAIHLCTRQDLFDQNRHLFETADMIAPDMPLAATAART